MLELHNTLYPCIISCIICTLYYMYAHLIFETLLTNVSDSFTAIAHCIAPYVITKTILYFKCIKTVFLLKAYYCYADYYTLMYQCLMSRIVFTPSSILTQMIILFIIVIILSNIIR